jgi:hypothetical protein
MPSFTKPSSPSLDESQQTGQIMKLVWKPHTLTFSKFFSSTSYSISAFGGILSSDFPSALKAYFAFSSIRDFSPFLNFSIALSRPSQIPNSEPSPSGKLSSLSSNILFPYFPTSLTENQCYKLKEVHRSQ